MAVEVADIARLKALDDTMPDTDELQPLKTVPQVFGYIIAYARSEGLDEDEMTELLARGSDMTPDTVRHCARVLRPLGYARASDRLRRLAGRRRHNLAPL